MDIEFLGAARRVTGSCYLIRVGGHRLLLDCGLFQGEEDEALNREPWPVAPSTVDAVVLSHAHIDHSGRLPLLMKQGFSGPVYTHHATAALCRIMLRDSGYLQEKDAEWANRKRARKGLAPVEPLYTLADGEAVMSLFEGLGYGERREILPGVRLRLRDAGHILGAAVVELWLEENGVERKLAFSGDLGYEGAPVMPPPERVRHADLVLLESTYGDRLHRSPEATLEELGAVFASAKRARGNVIIPAFAVGRTQDILYLLAEHYDDWGIGGWRVFLDSPMAIEATETYAQFRHLYQAQLFGHGRSEPVLPNLVMARRSRDSMAINEIGAGAIVIAGSGMCTGGRVLHHLKHNLWRPECHVVIVGFQAQGTLGRRLVDGAEYVRLWGEEIRANASIHTVGGLSAHADRAGLVAWYGAFENAPPVCLVHGEPDAQRALAAHLEETRGARVDIPAPRERLDLSSIPGTADEI